MFFHVEVFERVLSLHSIKTLCCCVRRICCIEIFSFLFFPVYIFLPDSQLFYFFPVLFCSNTCFNVYGSCLQEEEVEKFGVSVEMNATKINKDYATLNILHPPHQCMHLKYSMHFINPAIRIFWKTGIRDLQSILYCSYKDSELLLCAG